MEGFPEVTSLDRIYQREAYQAIEAPRRPDYWGVDQELERRPGWPRMAEKPRMMKNARWPIDRQPGEPASPMHGRPNKQMPPVFGTAQPLHGLAGAIRRAAYRLPDHYPSHWLTKMFADRVEVFGYRAKKVLPFVAPILGIGLVVRALRR